VCVCVCVHVHVCVCARACVYMLVRVHVCVGLCFLQSSVKETAARVCFFLLCRFGGTSDSCNVHAYG
jgi:hypothetical protein